MKAGKLAIATALGTDVDDIERYQGIAGLYYSGNTYYFSRQLGTSKKLPDGYNWNKLNADWFERTYQIEVYKAEV
jgi:hypothetical protein